MIGRSRWRRRRRGSEVVAGRIHRPLPGDRVAAAIEERQAQSRKAAAAEAAREHVQVPAESEVERMLNAVGEAQLASATTLIAVDALLVDGIYAFNRHLRTPDAPVPKYVTTASWNDYNNIVTMDQFLSLTDRLFSDIVLDLPEPVRAWSGHRLHGGLLPAAGEIHTDEGFRYATLDPETAHFHATQKSYSHLYDEEFQLGPSVPVIWELTVSQALWIPEQQHRSRDLVERTYGGLAATCDPQLVVNRGSRWLVTSVEQSDELSRVCAKQICP